MQKLRLYRPTMGIPVIVCTVGLKDAQEQEPILRQKGIPILYKPFDIDELFTLIKQQLTYSSS